jgi:hypothetical protein
VVDNSDLPETICVLGSPNTAERGQKMMISLKSAVYTMRPRTRKGTVMMPIAKLLDVKLFPKIKVSHQV